MQHNGLFIAIEGGDGSGKTTICNWLKDRLTRQGYLTYVVREPGGVEAGEKIRDIVLNYELDNKTQTLLFEASRRLNVINNIIPMLEKGAIVITDRYTLSTFIYQSKVGGVRAIDIYKLNDFATDRVSPDLTFILDINAETAIKRIQDNVREQNYIDKKSLDFHMKIDEEYRNYFGVGIRHIDANRDLSDIGEDILKHISYYVKTKAMPYEVKNDTTKTDL